MVDESMVLSKTHNENKPKKNAFMDWYLNQKESLEEEFPDLNSSELTKVAMKRFKEEQKPKNISAPSVKKFFGTSATNQQNTSNSETTSPTIDVDPKKRKACDDEQIQKPESKKSSATSKLQKFSFVKP